MDPEATATCHACSQFAVDMCYDVIGQHLRVARGPYRFGVLNQEASIDKK